MTLKNHIAYWSNLERGIRTVIVGHVEHALSSKLFSLCIRRAIVRNIITLFLEGT